MQYHCRSLSLLSLTSAVAQNAPGVAQTIFNRAVADFKNAHIMEAAWASRSEVAEACSRSGAADFWQRGIALYYAGRYQDCREQFESHRTVNPDDVENAAWHFLVCCARRVSGESGSGRFLPSRCLMVARPCGKST